MKRILCILTACLVIAGCSGKDDASNEAATQDSSLNGAGSTSGDAKMQARELLEEGNQLYKNDDDKGAARAFEEAIRLDPDLAEAHYRLGLTYYVVGSKADADKQFAEAVEAYQRQLRSNPDDPDGQYMLGMALNKIGKPEEAVKALKQAVKMAPEDSDFYFELGSTHSKLAQYQEAVAAFQKAIELDPESFRAQEALGTAKDSLQRKQAALKQIQNQVEKQRVQTVKEEIGKGLPPVIKQKQAPGRPARP